MKCDIEIFLKGKWQKAASFELRNDDEIPRGFKGSGFFEYDLDYALENINTSSINAVSCLYPVDFELQQTTSWPSFLLDLLPAGANRRYFLNELGLSDNPEADWPLLLKGGGNPPGNIRIAQASPSLTDSSHKGFSYNDVITRAESFIEYAKENNAPVAGSSGAQGDAPKYLLTQDKYGQFHADGALADHLAGKHWLVKFPRGKNQLDRDILRNECAYYSVARKLGLHVGQEIIFDSNILFIPRFDRKVSHKSIIRFGLESLSSISNITDFGVSVPMENLCASIARFSSSPEIDVKEFIFRDILNVALGNTDNHARNTSMIKYTDGTVRLAPLYDFAPMFLDDQGIARVCRWTKAERLGFPDWGRVAEVVQPFGINSTQFRKELSNFSNKIKKLPDIMKACKTDLWLINRLEKRINDVMISLKEAGPVTKI